MKDRAEEVLRRLIRHCKDDQASPSQCHAGRAVSAAVKIEVMATGRRQ